MDDLLTELNAFVEALADQSIYVLSDAAVVAAHMSLSVMINRMTAANAALVHDIDGRGIVRASGAANASTWLRDHSRMSIGEAHKLVALGKLLANRPQLDSAVRDGAAFDADVASAADVACDIGAVCGDAGAACGADVACGAGAAWGAGGCAASGGGVDLGSVVSGGVNCEQALAIGRVLADLPSDAGIAVTDKVEAALIDLADRFEPLVLRRLGDRVLAHVAPEVAERAIQRRLERDEREAARMRALTLTPDGLGRVRLRGVLDTESAAILNAAVDPLMKPIPAGPDGVDLRSAAARRADALIEVCRLALRTGELPDNGGQPPQLNITVNIRDLEEGVKPGLLDTDEVISAEALRRLACDAQILPVVLDGVGVPIDVGRARRLFTGASRTAILLRDGGCAFPGCDRPPRWVDVHHIDSWMDGGGTDRDNGVALCGYHHRYIHRQGADGWRVRMGFDGHPEFVPPIDIDPTRTPRRNPYHRRR